MVRLSRLARFEERRAYRRFFLTLGGSIAVLLLAVFLGVPALIKFSVFMGGLKNGQDAAKQQDATPPIAPHLEAPYTATNSAEIAISGYGEPGATVEIFLNSDSLKKILLGEDGQFEIANIPLKEGENKITALAKDQSGNTSPPSEPIVVTYKNKKPLLIVDSPSDGEKASGDKKETKIVGLTDPGNSVAINNRLVMVKNDGTFNFTLALAEGENIIKVIAADPAGNQTTVERKVTYSP